MQVREREREGGLMTTQVNTKVADSSLSEQATVIQLDSPIVQNRPSSSATNRIKMLSFLEANGTRDLMTSLATDSTLIAAARFTEGDPTVKRANW